MRCRTYTRGKTVPAPLTFGPTCKVGRLLKNPVSLIRKFDRIQHFTKWGDRNSLNMIKKQVLLDEAAETVSTQKLDFRKILSSW